jgi:hypothetical protein
MGKTYFLLMLPLWTIAPGCSLIENGTRNLIVDPIHFSPHVNEWKACKRNDKLAEAAWNYIRQINPECEESIHYARGFKQGFADYLAAGGTGAPPAIPPRQYWRTSYQTPRGHQAVDDWYSGFRHGAAMAQDSGFRQWITVPTSLAQAPLPDEPAEPPILTGAGSKPVTGPALAGIKKPHPEPPKKPESSAAIASRPPARPAAQERAVPAILPVRQEKVASPPVAEDKEAQQGPPIGVVAPEKLPSVIIKGADATQQGPPIGVVAPEKLPSVIIKGADATQQGPPIAVVAPERLPIVIMKGADPMPSPPRQPDKQTLRQADPEGGRK